jgi:fatty acid desaturase
VLTLLFSAVLGFKAVAIFTLIYLSPRLGLISHEASHYAIFKNRQKNDLLSLIGWNFLQGISFRWWQRSHDTHHAKSNSVSEDPDIQHLPFDYTGEQFSMPENPNLYNKIELFIVQNQHFLFWILATFIFPYKWISQSFASIIKRKAVMEMVGMVFHYTSVYFIFTIAFQEYTILWFLLFLHAKYTWMFFAFLLNHTGMPYFEKFSDMDYLSGQVISSRNVPDWFGWTVMGPLSFQIEHHLWPAMPWYHLRAAGELTREFCLKNDVPYHTTSYAQGLSEAYQSLKKAAYCHR